MFSREILPLVLGSIAFYLLAVVVAFVVIRRINRNVKKKEQEARRRMYELAILKEISDRTGYSLNIKKILDVITGSLSQFLEYSAVSYMLVEPAKIIFKTDLERSVSPEFLTSVKERMLESLEVLLGRDVKGLSVEETVTGAIMVDEVNEPVRSFFNIPVVISGQLVGVLTIADTKEGLYKEEEVAILYKIVAQASQAVTKLEDVVKTEQGKIAAMLESMVEGVVMTDTEYHIVAANPRAKSIIGKEGSKTLTIFDFMESFKGAFDMKSKLEEAIKLDKTVTLQDIIFGNKYYQILVSPVKSQAGILKDQVLGGVVIFHDITHEKEAEKMRSDFTSMMVHELRSPLGNIKKIGELLKSAKVLEDKASSLEYAGMLYDSSSSMLDLVNDLLDVAKLEAGKFEVAPEPVNIQDAILDRTKFFEPGARASGVVIGTFFEKGIPSLVSIDVKRIKQVINNLISNALNYTPKGGSVTVECFVHRHGNALEGEAKNLNIPWVADYMPRNTAAIPDSIVVAVTDTGEGINPEHLEMLWNKFTQFESSVRRRGEHKGTGLGLVIVKGIVEAHGGSVGIGSKRGTGSTSYFTIPF